MDRRALRSGGRGASGGDPDEAFSLANEGEFGLSAAVFSQDVTRVLDAVRHLDVGVLHNSESREPILMCRSGGARRAASAPGTGRCRTGVLHPPTTVYLKGGDSGLARHP